MDSGTLAVDGDTDEYTVGGDRGVWCHISGNFGGGTFKLQAQKVDKSEFVDIQNTSGTGAYDKLVELPHGTVIKGNLAGATTPNLYWQFKSTAPRRRS